MKFLSNILFALGIASVIYTIVLSIKFTQDCSGYLKQAADANTVELALDRLNIALNYIEDNNLTSGYTSIVYKTEDENISYWYHNLKACQKELKECKNSSQLEKTNVLIKVRESLVDNGRNGTTLTIPDGISRYPYNLLLGIFNFIGFIMVLGAVTITISKYSD